MTLPCAVGGGVEGVAESVFHIQRHGHTIPVALWRPAPTAGAAAGLVLLGHGGSGHKRGGRIPGLACWLVAEAGLAAAAIDGPYHGERVPEPLTPEQYQALIIADGAAEVVDRMTQDWLATIAVVADLDIPTDALGYFGLSMGARYGIPLAAALGDRLRCAVFGKFGLDQGPAFPAALDTTDITRAAAPQITARTLIHVQWHDELFPRDGQLALFDLIGSQDKRLIAYPGPHAAAQPDATATWRDFLAHSLT